MAHILYVTPGERPSVRDSKGDTYEKHSVPDDDLPAAFVQSGDREAIRGAIWRSRAFLFLALALWWVG